MLNLHFFFLFARLLLTLNLHLPFDFALEFYNLFVQFWVGLVCGWQLVEEEKGAVDSICAIGGCYILDGIPLMF